MNDFLAICTVAMPTVLVLGFWLHERHKLKVRRRRNAERLLRLTKIFD